MGKHIDRRELLGRLERVKYEDEKSGGEDPFGKLTISEAMLSVAEIDAEHEYGLCRRVAEHLLGAVPEPEEVDQDD